MTSRLTLLAALPVLCLGACADAGSVDSQRRAAIAVWEALDDASETPGTYWYEEHNCPLMAFDGTASTFQVTDGIATLVGRRTVCRPNCVPGLERYSELTPATLPTLIAECPQGAAVEFDADGVQTFCQLRSESCFDSCDVGYHIARWDHGVFEGDSTTDEVFAP